MSRTFNVVDTDEKNQVAIVEEVLPGGKVEISVQYYSHKEGHTVKEIMLDRAYAYDRMDEISGEQY
jgi:hypothetical protein